MIFIKSPHLLLDNDHDYSRSDNENYLLHGTSKVLQTTGVSPDFSVVNQQVLQHATNRGKRVHLAVELQNKGELDLGSMNVEDGSYFHGWQKFQAAYGFSSILQEQMFLTDIDGTQGNAGTIDDIAIINEGEYRFGNETVVIDKPTIAIVDYKTGSTISKSALFQVGGSYSNGYFCGLNGKNLNETMIDLVERKSGFKAEQIYVFILHIQPHAFKLIPVNYEKYIPKWGMVLTKYLDPEADINLDMLVKDQVYMSEHTAKRLLLRKRLENKVKSIKEKITRRAEDSLNIDGVYTSGVGFVDNQKISFSRSPDSAKESISWEMFGTKIFNPSLSKILEHVKALPEGTLISTKDLLKVSGIDTSAAFTKENILEKFNECKSVKEITGSYKLSIKKANDKDVQDYEAYLCEEETIPETEDKPDEEKVQEKPFLWMPHPAYRKKDEESLCRQVFKILVDKYKDMWEQKYCQYVPITPELISIFETISEGTPSLSCEDFMKYHNKLPVEKPEEKPEDKPAEPERKTVPLKIETPEWLEIGKKVMFRKGSTVATVTSEIKLIDKTSNTYGVQVDNSEEYTSLFMLISYVEPKEEKAKVSTSEVVLETKMPKVQVELVGVVLKRLSEFGYTKEEAEAVAANMFKATGTLEEMSEDVLLRLGSYMHLNRKNLNTKTAPVDVPAKPVAKPVVEPVITIVDEPVVEEAPKETKNTEPEQCGLF